ncbi:uncharacterized protein LOC141908860 isoform X2 [Tubulanus polymorphus]
MAESNPPAITHTKKKKRFRLKFWKKKKRRDLEPNETLTTESDMCSTIPSAVNTSNNSDDCVGKYLAENIANMQKEAEIIATHQQQNSSSNNAQVCDQSSNSQPSLLRDIVSAICDLVTFRNSASRNFQQQTPVIS